MADQLALFTGGQFAISHAKTAHGILRYGERDVICVVDSESAGTTADQVVPYARRPVPIVPTVAEAAQLGSLADYIDLDGHLLISSQPFAGLGLRDGRLVLSEGPGLGVEPTDA